MKFCIISAFSGETSKQKTKWRDHPWHLCWEIPYLLCAFLLLREGSTLWGGQNIFPMWMNYATVIPETFSWSSSFRKWHQQLSEMRFWTGKLKSLSLSPAPSLLLTSLENLQTSRALQLSAFLSQPFVISICGIGSPSIQNAFWLSICLPF